MQEYPNLRFVTLNGETVNFNYGITGGNNSKNEDSIIGREKQLQNFDSELKKVKEEIVKLNSEINLKLKEKEKVQEILKKSQIEHGRNKK